MVQTKKHPLEEVKWGVMPTAYRGCLVYKIIGGYQCLGRKSLTAIGVDEIINQAEQSIQKSIK